MTLHTLFMISMTSTARALFRSIEYWLAGLSLIDFLEWISAKEELNSADSEAARKFLGNLEFDRRSDLLMPFQGTSAQYRALRSLETRVIQRLLGLQAKDGRAHLELRPAEASRLYIADELALEVKVLKGLMRLYVYDAPALAVQQHGQRKIVLELFEILFNAVELDQQENVSRDYSEAFRRKLEGACQALRRRTKSSTRFDWLPT